MDEKPEEAKPKRRRGRWAPWAVVAATADWGGEPGMNPHESHRSR